MKTPLFGLKKELLLVFFLLCSLQSQGAENNINSDDSLQKQIEAQRRKNLIEKMAVDSTKEEQRKKESAQNYILRIITLLKSNIAFNPDGLTDNPLVEVAVNTDSNGYILNRKIIKPSGNKLWDEATIKAIDKTDRLPLHETKITSFVFSFRPKDISQ
jgi:colicin import membrane protein